MGLLDYISREPYQKVVNISTYDEQLKVAKLDTIKRSAKRFFLIRNIIPILRREMKSQNRTQKI